MARQSSKKPQTEAAQAAEPIAADNPASTGKPPSGSPEKAPRKKEASSGASGKSSAGASGKTAKSGGKGGSKPAAKKASTGKVAPKKTAAKAPKKPSAGPAVAPEADGEATPAAAKPAAAAARPQAGTHKNAGAASGAARSTAKKASGTSKPRAAASAAPTPVATAHSVDDAPETATGPTVAATAASAPAAVDNGAPGHLRTMPAIAYGQVKPLHKKRSHKGAIVAIAVIAAVVIAAVVAAPKIIESVHPDQILPSTSGPVTVLTTMRVSEDLENADIPLPDLSAYSYILTDDLIGPRFSTPDIEDMVQTVSSAESVYSHRITTKATYNNKGIRIIVPLSMVYTYDEDGQTWVHDEPVMGTPETAPLSAASYEAVLEDIDLIVRNYSDADYKALFKAAEVTSHTASLTKDGGTVTVELRAQTEAQTATSTATIGLTWDNAKGWVATITDATTPERTERNPQEEALAEEEEKEEEEYANEVRPQYHLECSSSDVVQFNGQITRAGNGYLLTLNNPLRLTLDGRLCYVYTVQLNFGTYDAYSAYKPENIDPSALVGSNRGLAGTLSLTGAGNQAVQDAAAKDRDHASEKGAPLVAMQVIEA